MKKLIKILIIFFILTLTSCNVATGDITNLMSPPKLTVEQQAIIATLNSNAVGGKNPTLKYPLGGDYRSSFILHNLDGSSEEEALAFYRPENEKAGTHVMILKKISGKWKKTADISGDGSEVDRIDFGDFDGNGSDEIAIGWTLFTGTDLGLGVYSSNGSKFNKINTGFTTMKTVDMDGDGKKDILLIKLDTAAKNATASLISYKDGRLSEIAHAPLDSTVSTYAGIYATKADNRNVVLIDGYKGAHLMVTELVDFKNGLLLTPFDDVNKKIVTATQRDVNIACSDIDNDGIIEVPSAVELPGYANINETEYDKKLWLVSWNTVANDTLIHKFSCVINNAAGYYFTYPDKWEQKVTVDRTLGDNDWSFRVWDSSLKKMGNVIFNIYGYSKSEWDKIQIKTPKNLFELDENNGMVYVVQFTDKQVNTEPYNLDISEIRKCFKLLK